MKEGEIIVTQLGQDLFYTAKTRRIFFLFRGKWKYLTPMCLPSYREANELLKQNL